MPDDNTDLEIVGEEGPELVEFPDGAQVVSGADLSPEALRKELDRARKEAAKYRTQLRDAEPFIQKAKELEEANKTEAQKLAEAGAAAEERAAKAEARLTRLDACLKTGLDPKFAGRLQGSTPEELEADAKELAELFAAKSPGTTPDPGRRPRSRLDTARPTAGAPDESTDPGAIAAKALKRTGYSY